MNKGLFFTSIFLVFVAACSGACGTTRTVSRLETPADYEQLSNEREHNRKLVDYFAARTVRVERDCTAKKGTVVVGVVDPDNAFDGGGTGVILRSYKDRSYMATAAHVISIGRAYKDAFDCQIYVQLNKDVGVSTNRTAVEVIAKNEDRDLAVLSVGLDFGVNSQLELKPFTGEDIWSVGYPLQFASPGQEVLSVTAGEIATVGVNSPNAGKYYRVTSPVYHGNSGGGTWNRLGKVVGIVVSYYGANVGQPMRVPYEGYYYIKPIDEVLTILETSGHLKEVFR